MTFTKTPKPATALHGEPASKIEHLPGPLNFKDTRTVTDIQAARLSDRFAMSIPLALAFASFIYGDAR